MFGADENLRVGGRRLLNQIPDARFGLQHRANGNSLQIGDRGDIVEQLRLPTNVKVPPGTSSLHSAKPSATKRLVRNQLGAFAAFLV